MGSHWCLQGLANSSRWEARELKLETTAGGGVEGTRERPRKRMEKLPLNSMPSTVVQQPPRRGGVCPPATVRRPSPSRVQIPDPVRFLAHS